MNWFYSLIKGRSSAGRNEKLLRYQTLRRLGRAYNVSLIKQLPASALPEAAKKLGLTKAGTIVINQDDEIAIAYDYCLHHHRPAASSIIDRTRENNPPEQDSDEWVYLKALSAARFSLFRILEILPHEGARLMNLLTETPQSIMDMSLSSTATPGTILAGRILDFDDFSMSSGSLIPVPEVVFERRIQPVIHTFMPVIPVERLDLSPARRAAFEAQVLRIALHAEEEVGFYTDIETG